ncbi:MAG: 3-deoxy-7-phosphoheptulonate synthase [Acidobacteria bacterium]|nr:3-deoxy-7-phosphoheptulonate synthase [Acidobacteriota bacterium]
MVIVMDGAAGPDELGRVRERLAAMGFDVHESAGAERTVLGAVGGNGGPVDPRELQVLPGVKEVLNLSKPYKLVSRSFRAEPTVIELDDVRIGGSEVVLMAGPCGVESEEQIHIVAEHVAKAGAKILRGGAFKPRSSPYSFQGLGGDGLRYLRAAAEANGLKTISEVMDPSQLELMSEYVDIFQVGARNMQNFALLKALGRQRRPVLLKRGLSATIEEWLMSAEYIMAGGNHAVILCERGIRTFERHSRNTFDISAFPIVKKLSHLPVIGDPSHAIGIRDKVAPLSRAAVAAGADGLIVEVHNTPEQALSDGPQSLFPEQFVTLVEQLRQIAPAIGRTVA